MAVPTGDVVQIGKGAVWGPDHYDTPCVVDYCSAACLLMRRADFLAVGGFGLEWEPAYYEDTDLCLKLWTQCGKVMVNPLARVVHIESKTTSDRRLQLHDISEINRARFVRKWGAVARERARSRTSTSSDQPEPSAPPEFAGTDWTFPSRAATTPGRAIRPVLAVSTGPGRGRADALRAGIRRLLAGGLPQRGVRARPSATAACASGRSRPRSASTTWSGPPPVGRARRGSLRVRRRDRQLHRAAGPRLRAAQRVPHPVPVLDPDEQVEERGEVARRLRRDLGLLGVRPP